MRLDALKVLAQEANLADMTQVDTGGGFEYPAGGCVARIVEYVEYGVQPRPPFEGKAKEPAPHFHLGFALYSKGYCKEDGTPRVIRTFPITMSRNDQSKAFQMFRMLNWTKKHTHFAQLLGDSILVSFVEGTDKAGKTRVNLDLKGFLPPVDPVSRNPYPCPEATDDLYKLFLWANPTMETWESLHISGDNNWMQDRCMAAIDYPGSALEALLLGVGSVAPVPTQTVHTKVPPRVVVPAPSVDDDIPL